jgi:hypothetical protein
LVRKDKPLFLLDGSAASLSFATAIFGMPAVFMHF